MVSRRNSGFSDEGLVIKADMDLVRKAATKVIYEFDESIESPDGSVVKDMTKIKEGDQVVFRENISPCPAIVVATYLGYDKWYIFTSADCPDTKCDDHQARKCARLIAQNFRILQDFFAKKDVKLKSVSEWRMSLAPDDKTQTIVDRATERWSH